MPPVGFELATSSEASMPLPTWTRHLVSMVCYFQVPIQWPGLSLSHVKRAPQQRPPSRQDGPGNLNHGGLQCPASPAPAPWPWLTAGHCRCHAWVRGRTGIPGSASESVSRGFRPRLPTHHERSDKELERPYLDRSMLSTSSRNRGTHKCRFFESL